MKYAMLIGLTLLLSLFSCGRHEHRIRVAATPTPQIEILELIRPDLKKQGIDLKIVEVDDYAIPNRLLHEKQVDANFFQHIPFLELQEKQFGYDFEVLTAVHLEPMWIYSDQLNSLSQLGRGASVAIPSDPSNEARALFLLQDKGLISLKKGIETPTIHDIINNPKGLKFKEIDAPFLPRALKDVTIGVIPSNFAMQAGLSQEDLLGGESADSPYANVVVIRKQNLTDDMKAFRMALRSEKVRDFLQKKYRGAIISAQ